jgi:hypothetical protein
MLSLSQFSFRLGRPLLGLVIAMSIWLAPAAVAHAAPATVSFDTLEPALESSDDGGSKLSLSVTNLTTGPLGLTATPADASDRGCDLAPEPDVLRSARPTDITIEVPGTCRLDNESLDFVLKVGEGAAAASFPISASPKEDEAKPNWDALWAFVVALAVLSVAAIILIRGWFVDDQEPHHLNEALSHLGASYTFKDSWAGNITIAAGLLTGIFGSSSVVKALLGDDAEASIALAIVGAAIAAFFLAAGQILVLATQTRKPPPTSAAESSDQSSPIPFTITVGGFVAGAVLVLTGAFGELWVVFQSAKDLDLGGWQDWIWIPAYLSIGLLVVYAIRSTKETLERGTTAPPAPPPSEVVEAARLIIMALKSDVPERAEAVDDELDWERVREAARSAAAEASPPVPQRSAIL